MSSPPSSPRTSSRKRAITYSLALARARPPSGTARTTTSKTGPGENRAALTAAPAARPVFCSPPATRFPSLPLNRGFQNRLCADEAGRNKRQPRPIKKKRPSGQNVAGCAHPPCPAPVHAAPCGHAGLFPARAGLPRARQELPLGGNAPPVPTLAGAGGGGPTGTGGRPGAASAGALWKLPARPSPSSCPDRPLPPQAGGASYLIAVCPAQVPRCNTATCSLSFLIELRARITPVNP